MKIKLFLALMILVGTLGITPARPVHADPPTITPISPSGTVSNFDGFSWIGGTTATTQYYIVVQNGAHEDEGGHWFSAVDICNSNGSSCFISRYGFLVASGLLVGEGSHIFRILDWGDSYGYGNWVDTPFEVTSETTYNTATPTPNTGATQTEAANQTATAAALTATYEANQTATAVALTATYAANQTATYEANQTATAEALTATAIATNQTATAYELTQAAIPPITQTHEAAQTQTAFPLSATAGVLTAMVSAGTPHFDSAISYGDMANFNVLLGIMVLMVIGAIWFLVDRFLLGREVR